MYFLPFIWDKKRFKMHDPATLSEMNRINKNRATKTKVSGKPVSEGKAKTKTKAALTSCKKDNFTLTFSLKLLSECKKREKILHFHFSLKFQK